MKSHSSKSSKIDKTKPSVPSKAQIIRECLSQARTSFKPARMLTGLSAAFIVVGIGFTCSGKASEGAIIIEGGKDLYVVSEFLCKQTKEAHERFDQKEKDRKDEE